MGGWVGIGLELVVVVVAVVMAVGAGDGGGGAGVVVGGDGEAEERGGVGEVGGAGGGGGVVGWSVRDGRGRAGGADVVVGRLAGPEEGFVRLVGEVEFAGREGEERQHAADEEAQRETDGVGNEAVATSVL